MQDPMKTLGDHASDADEDAVADEDDPEAKQVVEADEESTRGAAKRKHDEVTTEEAVAVEDEEDAEELFGDEGSENEDKDEGEVNVSADDQPEEEAEEPARKKAKGTDGEVKSA
jgi:hypothetical protein